VVKWCRDSTSCSRPAGGRGRVRAEGLTIVNPKTLMEHKNPALTALEVAGRDLLRYTHEFGLTPAAELNLAKPPRPDAGDDDPFGA
jgi:phage terminase small subunit